MNLVKIYRILSAGILLFLIEVSTAIAATIEYDFNFSLAGTGSFVFDDVSHNSEQLLFSFGGYGSFDSGATIFTPSWTSSVFGIPPNTYVNNDSTFFGLNGGTAYGLRLNSDGSFCVRPDADACVNKGGAAADLASGTYGIAVSTVPIPAAAWLFGSGLIGLVGVARRKKA